VQFRWDGRPIRAREGEPLAVSLLAAGFPILSRSFRFHRPRGLMCSSGQCGWCECEVDGRPSVRSCRVPVTEGLVARGEHALPRVDRDVLALLELGSRWIPPTFYHHRFLRPRRLRQRYLDVLRWFGGRGRLRPGRPDRGPARALRRLDADVLVVGGGPAGILAALGASEGGARVVLLETEPVLGSTWRWREPQHRELSGLKAQLAAANVDVRTATTAVGVYEGTVTAIGPAEQLEIRAGVVVAATGAREVVPAVPGNDLPGVMGARTVEWLVRQHGVLPGERAVVVGRSADGIGAGAALRAAGAAIVAEVETPELVRVVGSTGVRGVRVRGGRRAPADLVVVADRSPALELPLAAGVEVEWDGAGLRPATSSAGRTSVPWLRVVGSAAGRGATWDDPGAAREGGRDAAARDLLAAHSGNGHETLRHPGPDGVTVDPRAMVCFCEDVRAFEVRDEIAAGTTQPELLKRRTGALTGPCQGKFCLGAFTACLGAHGVSNGAVLPTTRPPLRPVRLGDLVAPDTDAG